MASIFLSYAREDRGCAETLARVLEQAGHEVWWDLRLDSGEEFSAEIEAALGKADVVLVAWSKQSVTSRWVRDEATVGGDTGRLVPLSIDGSLPPMGFRQFHTLDLTGWKGGKRDQRTAELLRSVERRLKGKSTAPIAHALQPKRRFPFLTGKRVWAVAATLVLAATVAIGVWMLTGRDRMGGPALKPTVALLPFTTASSDAELRNIAAQVRDSVSHTLSQTGVPVRLIGSAAEGRRSADFLLSGELSKSGDKVTAIVHVDEAVHGVTISTEKLEAAGDDVRNLPERIGVHIASFFAESSDMLDRRHPMDPALMAELLSVQPGDFIGNYQIMKRVVAKAPDEPRALTGLAFFTGLALAELPRDERQQAVIQGRRAAEKAFKLAPERGEINASWCFLHSGSRLAECEDHLRAASRIAPDEPWPREFLAQLMQNVGRFDELVALTNLAYSHSPYGFMVIRPMMRTLEFTGDSEVMGEIFPQAVRWYPGGEGSFFRNRLYGLLYRGNFEAMQRLEEEVADALPANYTRSGVIVAALNSKSQATLRRICAGTEKSLFTEKYLLTIRCMIAFATIGDPNSAYAIADKFYPRGIGRTPEETERIWLDDPGGGGPLDFITSPAAAPMRRDPRYLQLAERTGLLAYWRSGRLPDFCRTQPEPICAQFLKRRT